MTSPSFFFQYKDLDKAFEALLVLKMNRITNLNDRISFVAVPGFNPQTTKKKAKSFWSAEGQLLLA